MELMADWSDPPVNARLPSHLGLQPPSDSMNASVSHFTPVADITDVGDCGLPQPRYSYGATAMPGEAAWLGPARATWAAARASVAEASRARVRAYTAVPFCRSH